MLSVPLKYSEANAKLKNMAKVARLVKFLTCKGKRNRKIFSLDLLAGFSCPFAEQCLSKVKQTDDGLKIVDGPKTEFRCFSASQEAIYTNTYKRRKSNMDYLQESKTVEDIADKLCLALPKNAGIVRIHVSGDFYNEAYFLAWIEVANRNPDRLFYAYTKSLGWWVKHRDNIPKNLVLTASYGGRQDHLIEEHGLRYVKVVYSVDEAKQLGLKIDSNDSFAANPNWRDKSFALLIHGIQPKGSEAGKAVSALNGKGSYSRK